MRTGDGNNDLKTALKNFATLRCHLMSNHMHESVFTADQCTFIQLLTICDPRQAVMHSCVMPPEPDGGVLQAKEPDLIFNSFDKLVYHEACAIVNCLSSLVLL